MNIIKYKKSFWPELRERLEAEAFPPDKLKLVRKILNQVRARGDVALKEFTLKFDGVKLASFAVKGIESKSARQSLTPEVRKAFSQVRRNIKAYYSRRKPKSWREGRRDGLLWGEKITPIEKVGIYIPGGKAPLISSLFMTVVPAQLAGVPRIILASPPSSNGSIHPLILAAADFLGLKEIYKIGGAQAIAALAFGTESIPKVDKIVGPGNIYVTLAKKEVFGFVDIDILAGPSEVVILAEAGAPPQYIAADLLSQAEHGVGGVSILIATSRQLIDKTGKAIDLLLPRLSRRKILRKNLQQGTFLIKVKSLKEGIYLVNLLAPEHLEIMTKSPKKVLPQIKNAGAIFLGDLSPVAAGDYVAGPSHVLPTGQSAHYFSPLSVNCFLKKSSIICYNRKALKNDLKALQTMAELEGLDAHALSAEIRLSQIR